MTATRLDLRAGDLMFANHVQPKSADILILTGQVFLGQPRYPHHVGVIVEAARAGLVPLRGSALSAPMVNPRMVQAMPSGAEEVELDDRYWTSDYVYVRPRYAALGVGSISTPGSSMAEDVARAARRYVDVPYSFLDYGALAVQRVRNRGYVRPEDRTALERYVATSKHMICSQLADQALTDAGFHVFDDGRLPQDVTPGGLYGRLLELGPALVIRPGAETQD